MTLLTCMPILWHFRKNWGDSVQSFLTTTMQWYDDRCDGDGTPLCLRVTFRSNPARTRCLGGERCPYFSPGRLLLPVPCWSGRVGPVTWRDRLGRTGRTCAVPTSGAELFIPSLRAIER